MKLNKKNRFQRKNQKQKKDLKKAKKLIKALLQENEILKQGLEDADLKSPFD